MVEVGMEGGGWGKGEREGGGREREGEQARLFPGEFTCAGTNDDVPIRYRLLQSAEDFLAAFGLGHCLWRLGGGCFGGFDGE